MTKHDAPHWTAKFFSGLYADIYSGPLFDADATEDEADFLAKAFADAEGTLLDIGAGFGRHVRAMKKRKFDVVALDRFADLLQRHPKRGRRSVCGDMRALPFAEGAFAGAWCLFNTFGYFDAEDQKQALKEWARALAPGARLVMQVPNRPVMAEIAQEFAPTQMLSGNFSVIETYEYNEEAGALVGRGIWQKAEEVQNWEFTLRMYTAGELEKMLKAAGFELEAMAADYDGEEFRADDSPQMIVTARR